MAGRKRSKPGRIPNARRSAPQPVPCEDARARVAAELAPIMNAVADAATEILAVRARGDLALARAKTIDAFGHETKTDRATWLTALAQSLRPECPVRREYIDALAGKTVTRPRVGDA